MIDSADTPRRPACLLRHIANGRRLNPRFERHERRRVQSLSSLGARAAAAGRSSPRRRSGLAEFVASYAREHQRADDGAYRGDQHRPPNAGGRRLRRLKHGRKERGGERVQHERGRMRASPRLYHVARQAEQRKPKRTTRHEQKFTTYEGTSGQALCLMIHDPARRNTTVPINQSPSPASSARFVHG